MVADTRVAVALTALLVLALGVACWALLPGPLSSGLPKGPVSLAVIGPLRTAEEGMSIAHCPDPLVLRQGGFRGAPDSAQHTAASGNGWAAQARPGQAVAAWATCGPAPGR